MAQPEPQATLDDFVSNAPSLGVQAYVASPRGPSWTGASGLSRLQPEVMMTTGDRIRIGSITKTFTAALILRLVDQAKVTLDSSAATYVSGLPPAITVRHLLNHDSGLADYMSVIVQNGALAQPHQPSELLQMSLRQGPVSANYSNTNFIVLGMIVEKVTGQPFHLALREQLLSPVGLRNTYLDGAESLSGGAVPAVTLRNGGFYDTTDTVHPSNGWSAGALVSTAEDLALWFEALLVRKTVLSAQSLNSMLTPAGLGGAYGLGVYLNNPCRASAGVVWHDGVHPAGACAFLGYQPSTGVLVAVLGNTIGFNSRCPPVDQLACALASQTP